MIFRLSYVGVYNGPVSMYRVTTDTKERAENMALRGVGAVARKFSARSSCLNRLKATAIMKRSFHGTASTFDVLSLGQVRVLEHNISTRMYIAAPFRHSPLIPDPFASSGTPFPCRR